MEEWLKEKDERGVVLNASGRCQKSAFQEEREEVKAVGKATADVLQKKYMWKRFATQIRYVGRQGILPRQISLIDLGQPVSIDFSSATAEQQDHGVDDARELGMLGGGFQGMTQALIVLIAFVFPIRAPWTIDFLLPNQILEGQICCSQGSRGLLVCEA